jgi:hypothetical protein
MQVQMRYTYHKVTASVAWKIRSPILQDAKQTGLREPVRHLGRKSTLVWLLLFVTESLDQ